jgi:hypothetical protein
MLVSLHPMWITPPFAGIRLRCTLFTINLQKAYDAIIACVKVLVLMLK